MNKFTDKNVDTASTTDSSLPSPRFQYNSDDVNYVNLNYVDTSETSSQERRATFGQQNLQNNQRQQSQSQQRHQRQQERHQQERHQQERHQQERHQQERHQQERHQQERHQQERHQQERHQQERHQQERHQQESHQQERQKQQYQNHPQRHKKPTPHKTLNVPSHNTSDKNAPMTLKEMGFKVNESKNWNRVTQPIKTNLYSLLKKMVETMVKPNVQIRIGTVHFNCHMMVLQCYSEFFMGFSNELLIQLPEEQVTPMAFMMAYEWMLSDKPLIQREGIVELLKAGKFLRIRGLVNQCWEFLDDDMRIREDIAFFLYMEARQCGDLQSLEQLMISRIAKFFLPLVASYDFLRLTVEDIILLFSSNCIGVPSETEVFMSAVRWLNHNWANREQHVVNVMKTIRFGLMPPYFLMTLTKTTDCIEIDRILEHSEVKKMVLDGLTYSSMQRHYYNKNCKQLMEFLKRHNLQVPLERQWVRETNKTAQCADTFLTYQSFLNNLQRIQTIGKDYWRTLEFCNEKTSNLSDAETLSDQ